MPKMIVVRQTELKDCGSCCLQSIVRYYAGYVSLETIRNDTYTSLDGTSVYHIVKAAEKYGFDTLAKKILDKDFNHIILPAIVHVTYPNGLNHFMVLYEVKKDYFILMDPIKGKVKLQDVEFYKLFTGVLIEMFPRQEIVFQKDNNSLLKLFNNILKANKKLIVKLLICVVMTTLLTIIVSLYFKVRFEISNNTNLIIYITFSFFILILLKILFTFFKDYYINHLNKNVDTLTLSGFIKHIFHLPLKVIETRTSGEIISRINDIWDIKNLLTNIFVNSLLDIFLAFTVLIILFYVNSKMTLIMLLIMLIYVAICLISSPYIYKRLQKNVDYQTTFNSKLIESIDMVHSIKNLNILDEGLKVIEEDLGKLLYDNYNFTNFYYSLDIIKNFLIEVTLFFVYTYGFYLYRSSEIEISVLILFNALMFYFIDPIKSIIAQIPQFNFLRASYNKICDFLNMKEEEQGEIKPFKNGDIAISNLEYSYNNYKKIIDNFSLVIRKGEKIMIKGKSGCGKSTLCNILNRTLDLQGGLITVNDKNIMDYSLNTIKNNITYIGQKEKLITDTIKNNILLYRTDNYLFDLVCKVCEIENVVSKRAMRYEFGVNNDSNNISGGEKQRLIVARGLMNNSPIIILDEALSETDYYLERSIIQNIKTYFPDKTLIYVTHKHQDDLFDRVITM